MNLLFNMTSSENTDRPPRVEFLSIVKELGHEDVQTVVYVDFLGREVSENERQRTLGLVQGLNHFAGKFQGSSTRVRQVDTDQSRLVAGQLEGPYRYVLGFGLAYVSGQYTSRGLASGAYLDNAVERGYRLWRLNCGDVWEQDAREIEAWWRTWVQRRFSSSASFNVGDRGFMNLLEGMRLDSGGIDTSWAQLKDLDDVEDVIVLRRGGGVTYYSVQSPIAFLSLCDVSDYVDLLDFYFGLSEEAVQCTNFPEETPQVGEERSTSRVFDPLASVWDALVGGPQPAEAADKAAALAGWLANSNRNGRNIYVRLSSSGATHCVRLALYAINGAVVVLLLRRQAGPLAGDLQGLETTLVKVANAVEGHTDVDTCVGPPVFLCSVDAKKKLYWSTFPHVPHRRPKAGILSTAVSMLGVTRAQMLAISRDVAETLASDSAAEVVQLGGNWWLAKEPGLVVVRKLAAPDFGQPTLIPPELRAQLLRWHGERAS